MNIEELGMKQAFSSPTSDGMTLREYFALKSPIPNAIEASEILGAKCRESVPCPRLKPDATESDKEALSEWQQLPTFNEVWAGLTNQRRFEVCAISQLMYADALLAELAKK